GGPEREPPGDDGDAGAGGGGGAARVRPHRGGDLERRADGDRGQRGADDGAARFVRDDAARCEPESRVGAGAGGQRVPRGDGGGGRCGGRAGHAGPAVAGHDAVRGPGADEHADPATARRLPGEPAQVHQPQDLLGRIGRAAGSAARVLQHGEPMALIVQKYGGTSVGSPERIRQVAARVAAERRRGSDVVVVVSAMGDATDELFALAYRISEDPRRRHPRELDLLLSAGERVAMALLAMAIRECGVEALSFTGSQAAIITNGAHTV